MWLAFPERGVLSCYEVGYIRWLLLTHVKPKDLDEKSIQNLRFFWSGQEEDMERFLLSFVKKHLYYLQWYYERVLDSFGELDSRAHVLQ